jgi:hypothetical protein
MQNKDELKKALATIASLISKCKKVRPKLAKGSAQRTLIENRIKALSISHALIKKAIRG